MGREKNEMKAMYQRSVYGVERDKNEVKAMYSTRGVCEGWAGRRMR